MKRRRCLNWPRLPRCCGCPFPRHHPPVVTHLINVITFSFPNPAFGRFFFQLGLAVADWEAKKWFATQLLLTPISFSVPSTFLLREFIHISCDKRITPRGIVGIS